MTFLSDNGEPYIFRQNVCNNEFIYRKKNVDHCYPDTSSSIRSHSILQLKHCDNNEIKVFGRYTSSLEDNDAHIQPFFYAHIQPFIMHCNLYRHSRESERESVQSRGSRSLGIIDFDMSYSRLNIWFNDEDGSFKETRFAEFDTCIL